MKRMLLLLLALSFVGCKTIHHDRIEVLNRQNNIGVLKKKLDLSLSEDVDVLAPTLFNQAKVLFDKSVAEAQKSQDPEAGNKTASAGLEALDRAEKSAAESRATLADALLGRARAQEVQADSMFESEYNALEAQIIAAGTALEAGEKRRGLEQNVELARLYSELEVKALKAGLAEHADKSYQEALKAGAEKFAPITLKKAKNELEVAKKIVEIEKGNYDKARVHADLAKKLSKKAKYISEILVGFKKEKLSNEEIILWYQDQLSLVHKPLPTDLSFDMSNKDVVENFQAEIANSLQNLQNLESRAVASERKTAKLSHEMDKNIKSKEDEIAQSRAKEERFKEVGALFGPNEAEVLKKDNDIIIRLYGFYFPVGKAELLPQNYSLLNKIAVAIVKYPNASVEVEGHTDGTGSKKVNMRISKERAENVADFLTKVSGIEADRVTSTGVGSERPLFSNDTEQNRAKNRRIEVTIVNQ